MIHVAGPPVRLGPRVRQRCAWCGAVMIDQDLREIAVEPAMPGDLLGYPTWPEASWVEMGANPSFVVAECAEGRLPLPPDGACSMLDPAVTA